MRGATILKYTKQHIKLVLALTIGLVLGGASSVLVRAAVPDNGNVIHACVDNGSLDNLRIIDSSSASCTGSETEVTWSKSGIGPQGGFVGDLTGMDFRDASLPGRNFSGMDIWGANFNGANLRGSNFDGANLSGSSFAVNTKFSKASFKSANLSNVILYSNGWPFDLTNVDLTQANFTNAQLHSIYGGDFRQATFTNTVIGSLNQTNFSGTDLTNANLSQVNTLNFNGVDFSNANFSNLEFSKPTYFYGSNLNSANFSNTQLTGNTFFGSQTSFSGTNFTNATLSNVQFSEVDLAGATLTGVTWDNVTCPDGTNSNDNDSTCVGHLTYISPTE